MITRQMAAIEAAGLGCEPAAVLAVAEVESANSGFLAPGKPCILFEAQVFHNLTGGRFDASHPNISSPVWDRSLYKGGAAEWDRLFEAVQLDAEAAFKSASWGAFQIMGFNYAVCGYASVSMFVNAMKTNVQAHMDAFAHFIQGNPALRQAMISHDWQAFARGYNGPGAVAAYSAKISTAYQLHARQDAAFDAAIPAPPTEMPAPVFNPVGPPVPEHDPTAPPPAGYIETPTGNIVREDVKQSSIVKGADTVTKVTTIAGTAAAAAPAVGAVAGMDWKALLGVAAVILAGALAFAVYKLMQAKQARIEMNKQGVA
jgi:hypothetical protein